MARRFSVCVGLTVISRVLGSDALTARTTFGMIQGRVTDSTAAVLPGTTVTVTNVRTGDKRVVVTNEQGLYRAPNLSPSAYEIRVEISGFRTEIRQGVTLGVSETLEISFRLEIQSVAETLTVRSESPLVSTQSAEIGQKIESERVLDLPVNSRDFSRLAHLAPGAKVNSSGVASLAFNGGDIAQHNFLLDGTDATHIDNSFMSTWLTPTSFGNILNTFGRTESFGTSRQIQLAMRYDFQCPVSAGPDLVRSVRL